MRFTSVNHQAAAFSSLCRPYYLTLTGCTDLSGTNIGKLITIIQTGQIFVNKKGYRREGEKNCSIFVEVWLNKTGKVNNMYLIIINTWDIASSRSKITNNYNPKTFHFQQHSLLPTRWKKVIPVSRYSFLALWDICIHIYLYTLHSECKKMGNSSKIIFRATESHIPN